MAEPSVHYRRLPKPPGNDPRVDFDPADFARRIESHGYRVLWEKAARCACRNNRETEQPLIDCPVCQGSGWDYYGGEEVRAIIDQIGRREEGWIAFGDYATGLAQITVRPEHVPGRWHRFTLLDSVMEFSEVRSRRAGALDHLRYPIASLVVSLIEGEPGHEERVTRDLGVLRARPMQVTSDGRGLPGSVLRRGVDFEIRDEQIDWSLGDGRGTAPAPGQPYSITYLHRPRYVVVDLPHSVRDTFVGEKRPAPVVERLPVTVSAKLDFLVGGADA